MTEAITEEQVVSQVGKSAGWMIALGVLAILVGIMAIGTPFVAGAATTLVVGWMVLFSGVLEMVHAFGSKGWKTGLLAFLSGLLSFICGGLILSRPLLGMALLTLFIAAYFAADGIAKIIVAFKLKSENGWVWILMTGVISLILGILMIVKWPLSGAVAIGTLVGINILLSGTTMIAIGMAARRAASVVSDAQAADAP